MFSNFLRLSLKAAAPVLILLSSVAIAKVPVPVGTAPLDPKEFLTRFHENPREVLNMRPARFDENGEILTPKSNVLSASRSQQEAKKILIYKDELRRQLCARAGIDCEPRSLDSTTPDSAPTAKDAITIFVSLPDILRNPLEMERQNLKSHILERPPWSDSFWPVTRGFIARRYADGGFPNSKDWATNHNYVQARPAWTVSNDSMAPAEKYDALVGDSSWRLTNYSWNKGVRYMKQYGHVPSWTGLCHGWAPAGLMTAMPTQSITVTAHNGSNITFYPSDIKALASSLWGDAPPIVKFAGSRCKSFNPREDEIGRVVQEACYDVNPGTFHMALVNELGRAKRGFVMDTTFDFEVWNYPVAAYSYQYFNPQSLAVSQTIHGSVIPLSRFTIDKFRKYRNPATKSIVGIAMDVTHTNVTQPSSRVIDPQKFHTIRYIYDLELDEKGEIVGGEWYSNFHPDFLWNPPPGSRALSVAEKKVTAPIIWDGSRINDDVRALALQSSAKGEPLAIIVERLVQMAANLPPESVQPVAPAAGPAESNSGNMANPDSN